jgi:hypothetical protein
MRSFDQTPDKPQPFGFKVNWLALKTSDPLAVVDALDLKETTPANWESGLAVVYEYDPWIFVSPPVGGLVLAVGVSLPYPTLETQHDIGRKFDAMFLRLMSRFTDVQFYGSHRVVDFVAWARAIDGRPVRIFAYAGGGDCVLTNIGEQTPEEAKLRFANLTGLSPLEANDELFRLAEEQRAEQDRLVASGLSRREAIARTRQVGPKSFPGERDVVDLAGMWSINPMDLPEQDHLVSVGWAARLPENLVQ